ncbi:uncharacterized protein BCR38DRAFT_487744 [Pseudomassariella vexata]|uniref:Uncharacterized protein n=1 Tax=Pseudomassariella vexata TaxID=1141098 RepID=A0A1Y2DNE0_9PEZI|nr:uncharacterized protein BCR38DRAFT_487744 [Pseudomassariella vexata]ORY60674.1 hypothetical protein BCR38DRAFT_487744 [Pseudomassariella vexata]
MSGRQQLLLPPPPVVTDTNEEDTTVLPDLPSDGLTNERRSQIPVFPSSLKDVKRLWVLTLLTIHIVTGAAKDCYVRWEITDQKFWSVLQLQDPATSALASALAKRIKDVFVEITCGGPFDTFLVRLSNDRRRATGLFVQLYGDENEVPCRSCSKRLISSETGDHRGMWPMFGCRSIPGAFGHACGNCLAMVEGEKCTFRDDKYDHLRASSKRDPPLVSDLSSSNSPAAISFGLNALRRLYAQYKEHSSQAVRSNEGAQGAKGSPSGQGKGFWG